jgi:hypothetical protein
LINLREDPDTLNIGSTDGLGKLKVNVSRFINREIKVTTPKYIFFHPSIDVESLKRLGNFHLVVSDEVLVADGSDAVLRSIIEEYPDTLTMVVDMKHGDALMDQVDRRFLKIQPRQLSFIGSVARIINNFLSWSTSLTSLDVSGWTEVVNIGDNFLWGCTSLISLDISGLNGVVTIGDGFLNGCTSLTLIYLCGWCPDIVKVMRSKCIDKRARKILRH